MTDETRPWIRYKLYLTKKNMWNVNIKCISKNLNRTTNRNFSQQNWIDECIEWKMVIYFNLDILRNKYLHSSSEKRKRNRMKISKWQTQTMYSMLQFSFWQEKHIFGLLGIFHIFLSNEMITTCCWFIYEKRKVHTDLKH